MENEQPRGQWFKNLMAGVNALAEELGLDDDGTRSLREFAITTAKREFRAGNKSGIRWARMNPAPQVQAQA